MIKLLRDLLIILTALLCLVSCAPALGASDSKDAARASVAAIDDDAVSLEERQSALKKLKDAALLFQTEGEPLEAARALNRAGRLQLILNTPQDALASYSQALALIKAAPAIETRVDALNGLGEAYQLLKDKPRAEAALGEALSLSEQAGYTAGQAQALLTLSDLQNYDDHALALKTAQSALALWQSSGDSRGVARTFAQIGRCYLAQNALAEATQNYEKALQLWRELNSPPAQAGVLIMLGFIEIRKGEWQDSITLLTQAQSLIDERSEPLKMGQVAAGLAESFIESGLPENGVNYYRRALDYYRQTQDPHLIRYATWGLGVNYYRLGNYTEALNYLEQALEGADKNSLEAAPSYDYMGRVYGAAGEYAKALSYLKSALAIYTRATNPKEAALVRAVMGQIYQQQGRINEARQSYSQALLSFEKISDRVNQAAVLYALGRLELRSANYDAAEDYLQRSIEATENIRRVATSTDLTAAFSASIHGRYESYIECLMLKDRLRPSAGLSVRAFEISDLARARSLAEMLQATGTNVMPIPDALLAQQEKSLRQALRVKENYKVALLGRPPYKREALDALNEELAQLDAQYKQVVEAIRARYPSYEQIARPTGWNLQRIQEQVLADDQTVLLEYNLGEEKSYVWAVTRSGIAGYELPSQALINEAAQKVYESVMNPPGEKREEQLRTEEQLREAVQNLSRMILSPVASALNRRRIIIVPDGALNYIPFQILSLSSTADEPLVAEHEIINAPSASVLGQLHEETARRNSSSKLLAAFGDPVFASNYAQRKGAGSRDEVASATEARGEAAQSSAVVVRELQLKGDSFDPSLIQPLFYARRELENLRSLASADEIFMAEGFDATRERLQGTDLTRFSILHFATHGFLDPVRPENSGLMLSTVDRDGRPQDGYVGLQDIYGLHAQVDLVVLSACRTALGKEVRGEGLIGLTRGFMYAGASSVVASLWKVDDEATSELMKRFYAKMLQSGLPPAEALREAQNSIRQEPHWRSPYYWAAFTLQGEYHQIIKRPQAVSAAAPSRQLIAVAVLLTAALAMTVLYLRRKVRAKREGR